jgi:hypothetical protein
MDLDLGRRGQNGGIIWCLLHDPVATDERLARLASLDIDLIAQKARPQARQGETQHRLGRRYGSDIQRCPISCIGHRTTR